MQGNAALSVHKMGEQLMVRPNNNEVRWFGLTTAPTDSFAEKPQHYFPHDRVGAYKVGGCLG